MDFSKSDVTNTAENFIVTVTNSQDYESSRNLISAESAKEHTKKTYKSFDIAFRDSSVSNTDSSSSDSQNTDSNTTNPSGRRLASIKVLIHDFKGENIERERVMSFKYGNNGILISHDDNILMRSADITESISKNHIHSFDNYGCQIKRVTQEDGEQDKIFKTSYTRDSSGNAIMIFGDNENDRYDTTHKLNSYGDNVETSGKNNNSKRYNISYNANGAVASVEEIVFEGSYLPEEYPSVFIYNAQNNIEKVTWGSTEVAFLYKNGVIDKKIKTENGFVKQEVFYTWETGEINSLRILYGGFIANNKNTKNCGRFVHEWFDHVP